MYQKISNLFLNKYFLKFLIVGIISTIINYAFFYYLYKIVLFNYLISSAFGYILGLIFGFFINKFWTYDSKSKFSFQETSKYILVYTISLVIGLLFLKFQVSILMFNVLIANFFTICLTTITNYLGTKLVVFKIK